MSQSSQLELRAGYDWGLDLLAVSQIASLIDSFFLYQLENESSNLLVEVGACLIFPHLDILHTDKQTVVVFLQTLQSLYLPNPYHNGTHGAVVGHFTVCAARFLKVLERSGYQSLSVIMHPIASPFQPPFWGNRSCRSGCRCSGT